MFVVCGNPLLQLVVHYLKAVVFPAHVAVGAGADLHTRVRRRLRGGRSELCPEFHQRQWAPRSQGHAALGDGCRVPSMQQNGASGLFSGNVCGVSVQSAQA